MGRVYRHARRFLLQSAGVIGRIAGVHQTREEAMRFPALIPLALASVLSAVVPVFAQDWAPMTSTEDGFRANFPGRPKVEAISYTTEFGMKLPGRVYRASDPLGRYSTTVVDYRDVERLHGERSAACRAAKG